jgi:hypothetical protein
MTTQISLFGRIFPDVGVFSSILTSELSLANVKRQECLVLPFPTGADLGGELAFTVPQNYSTDPVLVIRGVIDGTPADTLAFGAQQLSAADNETVDAAYETEDLANNSTWTGYADEDMYEETIALTPGSAYVAGDVVLLRFYRDDSVDDTTFNFLLVDLLFQYTET